MEVTIAMSMQFAQIEMDLTLAYVNPATEGTGVNVKRSMNALKIFIIVARTLIASIRPEVSTACALMGTMKLVINVSKT